MTDIVKKIAGLKDVERKMLVGDILEEEGDLKQAFFDLVKKTDDGLVEQLYQLLPQGWGGYIKEAAAKSSGLSAERGQKAMARLEKLISGMPARIEKLENSTARARKQTLKYREVMKASFRALEKVISDQTRGLERGPLQKEYPQDAEVIDLPQPDRSVIKKADIFDCIADRASRRKFTNEPLSLAELSYLLWATQGIRKMRNSMVAFRTVPSGGCMHPFETYLGINNVEGIAPGLYRYQPVDHKLVKLSEVKGMKKKLAQAALGQNFAGDCAATFIWSAVPYRTEWRYSLAAKKIILQDSGHLCQNLYLACESIGCGTCAVGAYNQKLFDKMCGLDGKDEFVVYVAPVGKL